MTANINFQDKLPDFVKDVWANTLEIFHKTEDDVKTFVEKMVERGKMTEEEGKKLLGELKDRFEESREKVETRANESFEKALHMINLPTKNEVASLNKRVSTLTKKVNKLKKEIAA